MLNWPVRAGPRDGRSYLTSNPWGQQIRSSQPWRMPKELNPNQPCMTAEVREALIEDSPHRHFELALVMERHTRRRNNAVRQLWWSDLEMEGRTIRWRAEVDKTGRANTTPMPEEVHDALRKVKVRGIGDVPVFPSAEDPEQPSPRDTFQTWLRRAKQRWLRTLEPEEQARRRLELRGLGFHGDKRAGVRDPRFPALPPVIQEELSGTNYETLKRVYDQVTVEDMREVMDRQWRLAQ